MRSTPSIGRSSRHLAPRAVRDYVRSQLWPIPLAAVILSVVLAQLTTWLDRSVDDRLPPAISGFLFGGGPPAARSLMEAIAASTITVTSLTFSLTVVTLQLASSQYSPRLLRTFTSDRFVHNTLALFLATFAFALTVLRTIRDDDEQSAGFVPEIAVTFSFLLVLATVIGLVLFLGHLSRQLRVERMLNDVREDFTTTVEEIGAHQDGGSPPSVPTAALAVKARESGFLVEIDGPALLELAQRFNAVISVQAPPGDFLVEGVPFAQLWRAEGASVAGFTPDELNDVERAVANAVSIGFERNSVQDLGFALQQLLDVAVRTISPSVNDPTTCVHALGHLSAVLSRFARDAPTAHVLRDEAGMVRVVTHRRTLPMFLDLVVSQICTYGIDDPRVVGRLVELLAEVTWNDVSGDHRGVISTQAQRILRAISSSELDPVDRERLSVRCSAILDGDLPRVP
ncbi:putative membrane protein [Arthrobacter pigmenti]|uniref:Putative membrane protein n=1 Tax=Arthrobacter pigmenti TaxID=271432 RepID=A0A846RI99_9MICC|nr:DUF2254 domain-containing protein [Arthrobacter pigmenti]NJC21420.1 putative membrane protein [Arthrobacter pigmenti]